MSENTSKNDNIRKKLEAFKADSKLAQYIVTMDLADKLDELKTAIESIPTTEIPENEPTDMTKTNELLTDLLEKDSTIDLTKVEECLVEIEKKINEPINIAVTLDLV